LLPENAISMGQLRRRIRSNAKVVKKALLTTELPSILHDKSKSLEQCSSDHNLVEYTNMNINFVDNQSLNSQYCNSLENCTIPKIIKKNTHMKTCNITSDLENFQENLASWAVKEQINHNSLSKLFKILKSHSCFNNIPIDSRTLLKTPQHINLREVYPGHYWHYGLSKRILNFLGNNFQYYENKNKIIEIVIHVDGLPLSHSSNSEVWPILGSIFNFNMVFIVGLYYGRTKKPENASIFLNDFIKEGQDLVENGVIFNKQKYECVIKMICADAPAKSFLLNTKGHTGYSSCTKCWDDGNYLERRICFSDKIQRKRTDEEFILKIDEDYHKGPSALECIPKLGLVTNIPLDYQHLICLGVMKKMINLWFCDNLSVRLPFRKVQLISNILINIAPHIPKNFQRKPRSLIYFRQWKATEFRQFLLYTGPFVLKGIVSENIYDHFLSLHVATTILCSNLFCSNEVYLSYAEDLLQHFVSSFKVLYGSHHVSHNIHGLLHLVDDVKYYGSLDKFSCFKFENYMQQIKKLIRKFEKPLEQIARRIQEIENNSKVETKKIEKNTLILKNPHTLGPIFQGCYNQFETLIYNELEFTINNKGDRCCGLTSGEIIIIENICYSETHYDNVVIGKEFLEKENLYEKPCSSSILGIYKVFNVSTRKAWSVKLISRKYFLYPNDRTENSFIAIPLLHVEHFERPNL